MLEKEFIGIVFSGYRVNDFRNMECVLKRLNHSIKF